MEYSTMREDDMTRNDTTNVPLASTLTSSPLRNRLRVELKAPISDVWALIGKLARFPEYSFGLEKVEAKVDSSGNCTEYVCHFKPQEEGGEGIVHREIMHWYEPNRGFASMAEEDNAFGLTNSLTLVALEPSKDGTILTWDQYYDAGDLDMNKAVFDEALGDIGENLVRRFGGKVVERYVEK
jgi:hypothetical protein